MAERNITEEALFVLSADGVNWRAEVAAQGGDHLRVCLRAEQEEPLPAWKVGDTLDCRAEVDGRAYCFQADVLKRQNATLWLRVPPTWNPGERRRNPRRPGGFALRYWTGGVETDGLCLDISAGGLKMRVSQKMEARALLAIELPLPGEAEPFRAQGTVIYSAPAPEGESGYNVGIKFVRLSPEAGARLFRALSE